MYILFNFIVSGLLSNLALILMTVVYLVRGVAGFFLVSSSMGRSPEF
jgi:hypothetical protein